MSRALVDAERRPGGLAAGLQAAGILAVGLSALLFRPLALGRPTAVFVLGGTYLLLTAISVAVPVPRPAPALVKPVLVLGFGVGAFVLSRLVAGTRFPFPIAQDALALNTLAALAEEAFFRRFLFGQLAPYGPATAIFASALLFAVIHVPAYGVAAFWVDLGAGLLLSWQRWASGRWIVPAATHMVANLLAVLP